MTDFTLNGETYHTVGDLPKVGSKAPDFTLTKTDLGEVHLQNYAGTRLLLNIFPSMDTPVCAKAVRHFNDMANENPNTLFICISADLPFAQKRFCEAQGITNLFPASVFRHPQFGNVYGLSIADGPLSGLLARAILIINEQAIIEYAQFVKEISDEPDYDAIRKALAVKAY